MGLPTMSSADFFAAWPNFNGAVMALGFVIFLIIAHRGGWLFTKLKPADVSTDEGRMALEAARATATLVMWGLIIMLVPGFIAWIFFHQTLFGVLNALFLAIGL